MRKIFLYTVIILCNVGFLGAQTSNTQKNTTQKGATKVSIFNAIENNNASSSSKITFYQDERIENLLSTYMIRIDPTMPYSGSGYRIQVFSSNNFKTAKSDAARVERKLQNAFPQHRVYVTFASPFWKVRIGNFRTSEDAQKLRSEIIRKFPELRKDCYAVKDSNVKVN